MIDQYWLSMLIDKETRSSLQVQITAYESMISKLVNKLDSCSIRIMVTTIGYQRVSTYKMVAFSAVVTMLASASGQVRRLFARN